jgi:polyferredoxin
MRLTPTQREVLRAMIKHRLDIRLYSHRANRDKYAIFNRSSDRVSRISAATVRALIHRECIECLDCINSVHSCPFHIYTPTNAGREALKEAPL